MTNLNIDIKSLPNNIEKFVISILNLKPPYCYGFINSLELNNVVIKTKNKFKNYENMITNKLIKSIRASFMRNFMMFNHKNLTINSKNIYSDYKNDIDVLDISKKYNVSPLNLLRDIFFKKYKEKLTKLILDKNSLSSYDLKQLNIAIKNDAYSLVNQDSILYESLKFEKKVEEFLKINNIKFKTQEQLVKEQIKLYNKPINTPDFYILSDLYINNNKINWIDAKNFYGANTKFINYNIKKQTKKYINEFGSGSIIFNLGFNEKLQFNNILIIDYISIKDN